MGFLSFSAIAEMQKTMKQNRELLRKRKSMKEISKNFHEKLSDEQLSYNKMSESEFAKFKLKVESERKAEQKKRLILLGSITVIGIIILAILI